MSSHPSRETRDKLIDRYLTAADAEEFERYRDIFASDVEFISMGHTSNGVKEMIDWFENTLVMTDLYHDYDSRLHDGDCSIAHGEFGGTLTNDDTISGRGLILCEFNDEETEITKMIVFTSLQPHV